MKFKSIISITAAFALLAGGFTVTSSAQQTPAAAPEITVPEHLADYKLDAYSKDSKTLRSLIGKTVTVSGILSKAQMLGQKRSFTFSGSNIICNGPAEAKSDMVCQFAKEAKDICNIKIGSNFQRTWLLKATIAGKVAKNSSPGKVVLEDASVVGWYGIDVQYMVFDEEGKIYVDRAILEKSNKELTIGRGTKYGANPPPLIKTSKVSKKDKTMGFFITAGEPCDLDFYSHSDGSEEKEIKGHIRRFFNDKDGSLKVELEEGKEVIGFDSDPQGLGSEMEAVFELMKKYKVNGLQLVIKATPDSSIKGDGKREYYKNGQIVSWENTDSLAIYQTPSWIKQSIPLNGAKENAGEKSK